MVDLAFCCNQIQSFCRKVCPIIRLFLNNQVICIPVMEELYTFNSQQLKVIKTNHYPGSEVLYRKKILSCNISARVSPNSKQILLQQKQNDTPSSRRKSNKKVQFALPLEKIIEQKLATNNQNTLLQTKSFVQHKVKDDYQFYKEPQKKGREGVHIRPIRAIVKRAFSAVERDQNELKNIPLGELKQLQNKNVQRRQKKSSSVKLSPKINFPMSNRKLPSAFKAKFGEKYLQKVIGKQANERILKIPSICQKQILIEDSCDNLSGQIQKFKKRLMVQSKLFQKLKSPL